MDASKVRRIIKRELPRLTKVLRLQGWLIEVACDSLPQGTDANVNTEINYRSAAMCFDPNAIADEVTVKRVLLHECLHLVLSEFSGAFDAVRTVTDDNVTNMLNELETQADERTVTHLQCVLWPMLYPEEQ